MRILFFEQEKVKRIEGVCNKKYQAVGIIEEKFLESVKRSGIFTE